MLLTLESRETQLYPKHLNKEQRFRRKGVKTGRAGKSIHAAGVRDLPSASWRYRWSVPMRLQLMYGSTSASNVVATDITEAFSTANTVYVHSSLLSITDRVQLQRHLGKSEFVCLDSGTGEQVAGSLNLALRWVSHRQGWFQVAFIIKVRHTMIQSGLRTLMPSCDKFNIPNSAQSRS